MKAQDKRLLATAKSKIILGFISLLFLAGTTYVTMSIKGCFAAGVSSPTVSEDNKIKVSQTNKDVKNVSNEFVAGNKTVNNYVDSSKKVYNQTITYKPQIHFTDKDLSEFKISIPISCRVCFVYAKDVYEQRRFANEMRSKLKSAGYSVISKPDSIPEYGFNDFASKYYRARVNTNIKLAVVSTYVPVD